MKERLLFTLMQLLLLCYSCADTKNGGLTIPEAAAGNAVVSTARLDALVEHPDDPDLLADMTTIYGSLSTLANTDRQDTELLEASLVHKSPLPECVVERPTVVVYEDCTLANGTIEGTMSSSGDDIDFDLTIRAIGTGGAGSLTVAMRGRVSLTAQSLEGSLVYDTVIEGLAQFPDGLDSTLEVEYRDIALDEVQCPLSGVLAVAQTIAGESTSVVEAAFGPACLQVELQ